MTRGAGWLNRRDFIKGTFAALVLPGSLVPATGAFGNELRSAGPSVLTVAENPDPFSATLAVMDGLGGMAAFVPKGSSVLVKPNIGWDRRVEQAANTHPEVVRAIIQMCLESGASDIVILDRTCNDARRCYVNSGMTRMVEGLAEKRVRLEHVRNNRYTSLEIPRGRLIKKWPIYDPALETDVLINVPIAKHHSISGVTLGMKNLMGLMGGNRGTFHSGIGQKLADLTSALTPDLTVLDATRILVRNGPSGGRLKDVKILNRVAASADPVALDAYGVTLFDLQPADVSSVAAGYEMGLGEMDLARVRIVRT
jgi:uncharacterized protein (DUF362 family)